MQTLKESVNILSQEADMLLKSINQRNHQLHDQLIKRFHELVDQLKNQLTANEASAADHWLLYRALYKQAELVKGFAPEQAVVLYREAIAVLKVAINKAEGQVPANYYRNLWSLLYKQANLMSLATPAQAVMLHQEAVATMRTLIAIGGEKAIAEDYYYLSESLRSQGDLIASTNPAKAAQLYHESAENLGNLMQHYGKEVTLRTYELLHSDLLSQATLMHANPIQADRLYKKAIEPHRFLISQSPEYASSFNYHLLAESLRHRANLSKHSMHSSILLKESAHALQIAIQKAGETIEIEECRKLIIDCRADALITDLTPTMAAILHQEFMLAGRILMRFHGENNLASDYELLKTHFNAYIMLLINGNIDPNSFLQLLRTNINTNLGMPNDLEQDDKLKLFNNVEAVYTFIQYFEVLLKAGELQKLTDFLLEKLAAQQPNESREVYIIRIILAGYLLSHFNLRSIDSILESVHPDVQVRDLLPQLMECATFYDQISLSNRENTFINNCIHMLEVCYFLHLVSLAPDNMGETAYTQWAVDVITHCNHMHFLEVPFIGSAKLQELIIPATHHLFNLLFAEVSNNPLVMTQVTTKNKPSENLSVDYDALQLNISVNHLQTIPNSHDESSKISDTPMLNQLCKILFHCLFVNQKYDILYREFLRFHKLFGSADSHQNASAQIIRDEIVATLQLPISERESPTQHLDRLATVIVLLDAKRLYSEIEFRRWANLIYAQQVVDREKSDRRLTSTDLEQKLDTGYSVLPKQHFDDFVSRFPADYLRALCRVYQQYSLLGIPTSYDIKVTMIKNYLLAQQSLMLTSSNQDQLTNELNEKDKELVESILRGSNINIKIVLEQCSEELITTLIFLAYDKLEQFFQHMSTFGDGISEEALTKLGRALVKADRHRDFINELLEDKHKINEMLPLYKLCAVIFKEMNKEQESGNIACIINFLRVTLNHYADQALARFQRPGGTGADIFPLLLTPLSAFTQCYENEIVPTLNQAVYRMLVSPGLNVIITGDNPFQYRDVTPTLLCLLKHGASLLTPQAETFEQGKKASNALLHLISQGHFDVLKAVFHFYIKNHDSLVEIHPDTQYGGRERDPLCTAINNGADYELTTIMLNLGFSQSVVQYYLSEARNSEEVEMATVLRSNAPAIRALQNFNQLKLQQSEFDNQRLRKEITELARNEFLLQQDNARLRQQLESQTDEQPAMPTTPPQARRQSLGFWIAPPSQPKAYEVEQFAWNPSNIKKS